MNTFDENNPRHERPSRRGKQTRREKLENKEQENLKTERMNKNRAYRHFSRMENRGWGRPEYEPMRQHQERPHRQFGWRTEETCWSDEITPDRDGFRQRANRRLRRGMHWAVRPRWSEEQTPEHTHRHRWAMRPRHADEYRQEGGEFRGHRIREHAHQAQPSQKRSRWSMRPRHADEFRREGGEFRGHRIREQAFWAQPGQGRRHWSMRHRHADDFRREGGEFIDHRIRERDRQAQPNQQRHPSHILREKWMLEEKLFRITRRIQRLNRQLRG